MQTHAEKLLHQSNQLDAFSFLNAVHTENLSQLDNFLDGTHKYRFHPYVRNVSKPYTCASFGNSTLFRYSKNATGIPVFVIPSLVNKSHILDLMEDFSFMRFLASENMTPYLLDWGDVTETEKEYSFDDYYEKRLIPALNYISQAHGNKSVHTVGYCMGGTMGIALAQLCPKQVASLTLIAAPWNFHSENKLNASLAENSYTAIKPVIQTLQCIPPDMLQFFFTAVDPLFALKKYGNFARMAQNTTDAEKFVAVEDWLNDGVPLVEKIAETAFVDWYGQNKTYTNEWMVCGQNIVPEKLKMPIHIISATRDQLVPPSSAMLLSQHTHPHSATMDFETGHIGLMAGSRAKSEIWPAISSWICATQNHRTAQ